MNNPNGEKFFGDVLIWCSVEPAARPNRRTAPTLQQNQDTTKVVCSGWRDGILPRRYHCFDFRRASRPRFYEPRREPREQTDQIMGHQNLPVTIVATANADGGNGHARRNFL